MNNKSYTYVYLDIRKQGNYVFGEYCFDYEPFYVGKGCNKRAWIHLDGNKHNTYFNSKIKKIQKETGKNPLVIIYREKLQEQIAFDLESDMIKTIGRHDLGLGPLCNLTDGGDGGINPSKETIQKNRDANSGIKNPWYGKHHTKESNDKNRIKHIGKKNTLEHNIKISEANIGEKNPNSKEYKITFPNGEVKIIKCLTNFCRENNINYKQFRKRINTNKKYYGYLVEKFISGCSAVK